MRILHLYPNLLNLYGEYGNVDCLKKHMEDQGFRVNVVKADSVVGVDFDEFDFIYCGSGLETNLLVALKDLMKKKKEFVKAINDNKYILLTGNAMELLGMSIDNENGLGLVNITTKTSSKRYTGDVVLKNNEFGEVVGFINKSTIVKEYINDGLFEYVFKDSNLNDISVVEGYRINNLIGTHIIGPALVKNPKLMRFFVEGIGKQIKKKYEYQDISYPYEEDSYNVTLNALKERIKK